MVGELIRSDEKTRHAVPHKVRRFLLPDFLLCASMVIMKTKDPTTTINRNFNKLCRLFKNKWVATSGDYATVVFSGESIKQVMREIGDKNLSQLKIFRVVPSDLIYSPVEL